MEKPKVFIGSSTEGLLIAEAVYAEMTHETKPTLWKNDIFLPSQYPMETLLEQLKVHSFAIIVASPDDVLVKRGERSQSMRDNILFEVGLFAGVIGRKRTFLMLPENQEIAIPSDLFGLIPAKYDDNRIKQDTPEFAAAVQVACSQIRQVIRNEWSSMLRKAEKISAQISKSETGQAVSRMYDISVEFRDVMMAIQRDAFEAISDRKAFDELKDVSIQKIQYIVNAFEDDTKKVGVENHVNELSEKTIAALVDLPFPEELDVTGEDWSGKAVEVGLRAFESFKQGRNPMHEVSRSAESEFNARVSGLKRRFGEWWDKHFNPIHDATSNLQDALFRASIKLGSSI